MTNEEIKNNLKKLFEFQKDFSVIQTGKCSSRVNGFYKPDTCEIFIHNKNFNSDNELMYTALHEVTHHILTTEKCIKSAKCHSGIFWATFYDFIDKAVELKIYSRNRCEKTKNLVNQAADIQKQIVELEKQLAKLLSNIFDSCSENNERVEDVINHDLQMSSPKVTEILKSMEGDYD